MKIKDILAKKGRSVKWVRPAESLDTLCHRLRIENLGALIVSENGVQILGIVSERDVVACIAARGAEAVHAKVSDIMTARVVTCSEDEPIGRIARNMSDHRFRHIPVVENGAITAVVSIGDIVKNRLDEVELEAGVLRDIALAAR